VVTLRRLPRLPLLAWLMLGVLPIGLDGFSHFLNDIVAGTSSLGFRDTNTWLQVLTANALPSSFYVGDQLGSFNSWARWITGLLFGFATVFALFPIVNAAMQDMAKEAGVKLKHVGVGA